MASTLRDREDNTPFLLRLFYRQGAFHRPEEFASRSLPPSLSLHAWPSCTLDELACQIASERPALFPSPSIGTRLAFRLVYPDARSLTAPGHGPPRFIAKDLGSVVIGEGTNDDPDGRVNGDQDVEMGDDLSPKGVGGAGETTLEDFRYVIGDYVSCAILPPLADGSVAPEAHARRERPGAPGASGGFPGPRRDGGFGRDAAFSRDASFGRDTGFGRGDGRNRRRQFGDVPMGEWRRGERLPDEGPDQSWGRGGRRGR